jgi:hypothetical protein
MMTSSVSDETILPKAGADDHADGEIEHVTARDECLEFAKHPQVSPLDCKFPLPAGMPRLP